MSPSAVFWLLAAWAAVAVSVSDTLAVRSDPTTVPWARLAVMAALSASSSWIFWGMWRLRGTMATQAALDLVMIVPHVVAVLAGREAFTGRQWVAFAVFLAAGYYVGQP